MERSSPTKLASSSLSLPERFYLYVITRRETGKRYFGYTSEKPEQRWWRHKNHAVKDDGYALHDAIRKYGVDAFDFLVLAEFTSLDDARAAEIAHIAEHKTNCRREGHCGYNMTDGGEGATGYTHSEEIRARISQSKRGRAQPWSKRPKTAEHRANLSASKRGKKFSPEHIEALRKAARRRKKP